MDDINDGVSQMSFDDVSAFRSVKVDDVTAANTIRNAKTTIKFAGDTKVAAKKDPPVGMPVVMDLWKDLLCRKRCSLTFHAPSGMKPTGRVSTDNQHFITRLQLHDDMATPESSFHFLFDRKVYKEDPSQRALLAATLETHPKVIARRTAIAKLRRRNPDTEVVIFEQRISIPFKVRHALVTPEEDPIFFGKHFVPHVDGSKHWHVELIEEQLDSYSIQTPGFGLAASTDNYNADEDADDYGSSPATSSNFSWKPRQQPNTPSTFNTGASSFQPSSYHTPPPRKQNAVETFNSDSSMVGSLIEVPTPGPTPTIDSRWGQTDVDVEGGRQNPICCDQSTGPKGNVMDLESNAGSCRSNQSISCSSHRSGHSSHASHRTGHSSRATSHRSGHSSRASYSGHSRASRHSSHSNSSKSQAHSNHIGTISGPLKVDTRTNQDNEIVISPSNTTISTNVPRRSPRNLNGSSKYARVDDNGADKDDESL